MFKKTIFSRMAINAVLLGVTALYCTGCIPLIVGAAAGAGGVIWAKGALEQEFNKPMKHVYNASKAALQKLKFPITADTKTNLSAKLESQSTDGKHIWIDITYIAQHTTKISIRVGPLGDELQSKEISDMIAKYL